MKIVMFKWNRNWGSTSGQHLIIGRHKDEEIGKKKEKYTSTKIYGMSLDITDEKKKYKMKKLSLYNNDIKGRKVKEVTREEARAALIEELDKNLDVLFNEESTTFIDRHLAKKETLE